MKKRKIGNTNLETSLISHGCWQAATDHWNASTVEEVAKAMQASFELGINHFDTAESYGNGFSEQLLGKTMGAHRKEILISTKVRAQNYRAKDVVKACENSLRNLATDYIDIYWLHWPAGSKGTDASITLEETMSAMGQLQNSGKIRLIGLSNFNKHQLKQGSLVKRVDCHQPPMSVLFRPYVTDGTMDYCIANNISVFAYSPLAHGLVSGKFTPDNKPRDTRASNFLFQEPYYSFALQTVKNLEPIATKYQITLSQLSLAWLIAQPGITSAIVGGRLEKHMAETVELTTIELSIEDRVTITKIGDDFIKILPNGKMSFWH